MNKGKAIGSCLATYLGGGLFVGLVGWGVTALFPDSYSIVSIVGGLIAIILVWNAISTFIKILRNKAEAVPPPENPPADPGSTGQ